jgi:hypothetical protein
MVSLCRPFTVPSNNVLFKWRESAIHAVGSPPRPKTQQTSSAVHFVHVSFSYERTVLYRASKKNYQISLCNMSVNSKHVITIFVLEYVNTLQVLFSPVPLVELVITINRNKMRNKWHFPKRRPYYTGSPDWGMLIMEYKLCCLFNFHT